jgi:hypothetical protein
MAAVHNRKRGDTLPYLDYSLKMSTGGGAAVPVDIDLTGATVAFHFKPPVGAVIVVPGTVVDNTAKTVRATITTTTFSDLAAKTELQYHVEIRPASGGVLTFPTIGAEKAVVDIDFN